MKILINSTKGVCTHATEFEETDTRTDVALAIVRLELILKEILEDWDSFTGEDEVRVKQ